MVAEKMLMSISQPHFIAGQELRITPSIGIAVYPDHGETREDLIRNASIAQRSIKDDGGNNHTFYLPTMAKETPRRERLESDLPFVLERDELVLYYQPQIDARKGTLIGAEALARWVHPELGLISPAEFIPIAEESGFINDMGAWVLRRACMQKLEWEKAGLGAFPISVNVSFRQLKSRSFAEVVVQILEETGLDPEHLDIEITENMIMDDVDSARETLSILSDIGVHVSIDDFGTGYSSLSVLGKFPAQTLKIDRAFVIDITTNPVKAAITRTIIAVAHELGMRTIAEGVEDHEQMNFLSSLGCELMQGYLFGRPVDTHEFVETWRDGETEIRLED
jgi:EAL domain-containing protein (putative c-di-GMP-specific phosphodiesterase class I)